MPSEWAKHSRWLVSLAWVLVSRSLIRSVKLCCCWNPCYELAFSEAAFSSVGFCRGFQISLHLEHSNTQLPSKHRITLPSCKWISCTLRTARVFSYLSIKKLRARLANYTIAQCVMYNFIMYIFLFCSVISTSAMTSIFWSLVDLMAVSSYGRMWCSQSAQIGLCVVKETKQ